MGRRLLPFYPVFGFLTLFAQVAARAEPLAELAAFSAFKTVNLEKLASGQVMSSRGTAMSSPRDLAVENCYVVRKPLAKTVELLRQWNATRHPELKVYVHVDISMPPTGAQLQQIGNAPANASVKALATVTEKLPGSAAELQLSQAEAKAFKEGSPGGRGVSPAFTAFWSGVLQRRAEALASGGLGALAPYETKGETIRCSEEVARLLKSAGKVRAQFSSLIEATPLGGGKGSLAPICYWEMFDVEGQAAFNLGALYTRPGTASWQAVDTQYYASGGLYALLTFYQMWPVSIGGQECTLVWRGDLVSSPGLASLRGVERMGSSTAMMRETQKSIKCLLDDVAKSQ
jgi:hypothetical protein